LKISNQIQPILLGNVYGAQFGTGYAGNVWDKDFISPTLRTMQGGEVCPTITATNPMIYVIEPNEK